MRTNRSCICSEHHTSDGKYYQGDVKALHDFGFDAVKLDGCGVQTDLQQFYTLMQATGKKYTIEVSCSSCWAASPACVRRH